MIADRYDAALGDVPGLLLPPPLPPGHQSSYYLYWVQIDPAIRDHVARALYERGIYTTFRYPLLHQVRAYGAETRLPNAEQAAETTLCLPLHQGLSDADVDLITTALAELVAVRGATQVLA